MPLSLSRENESTIRGHSDAIRSRLASLRSIDAHLPFILLSVLLEIESENRQEQSVRKVSG